MMVLAVATATTARATTWQTTASCPFTGSAGDLTDRGFYVTNYSGYNLGKVELGFMTSTASPTLWSITLTARRGGFAGPLIGSRTETQTLTSDESIVVFDFDAAPVSSGDTIAFSFAVQKLAGPSASLFFDDGGSNTCAHIFETNETTPPLDTVRRNAMSLLITQAVIATSCLPSDTVLCLDDQPGDNRFKATVSYHTAQGGGLAGNGQAVTLDGAGVRSGLVYV
jgi:hypothetical protein